YMKILHTADWHIGKKLNGRDLIDDQRFVLEQLMDKIQELKPDINVVAGDLYDGSNPTKDALNMVKHYLYKMNKEMGLAVLIISGNHDSKALLDYGSAWFKASDLCIHTSLEDIFEPVVTNGHNFYLVPHIDVLEARHHFENKALRTHHDVYQHIAGQIDLDENAKNILIGYLFIQDGRQSESERALSIGDRKSVV